MPMEHSGAAWQRAVLAARRLREFTVHPGTGGYRVTVQDLEYAPEYGLAWMTTATGTWKLPRILHEWARSMIEDVAADWGRDPFPFAAVFFTQGEDVLIDMDPRRIDEGPADP